MEREDIIRMAREAGLAQWSEFAQADAFLFAMPDRIERFAALVAAEVAKCEGCGKPHALYCLKCCEESIVQTAVKEEREACERIAKSYGGSDEPMMVGTYEAGWFNAAEAIAAAIRARGEEPKRHPGYIIGDHWLQAAYTRVCTGETEDEVMTDYGWQRARGEK